MSLGITWIAIEEAAAKYALDKGLLLKWIEAGVVRAEQSADQSIQVNVDDIELMVQERAGARQLH